MSRRVNQLWPDGLYERVAREAGKRGVTDYTTAALELALKDDVVPVVEDHAQAMERQQVNRTYVPGPEDRRCKLNCGRPVPQSPKAVRCSCGGFLVP